MGLELRAGTAADRAVIFDLVASAFKIPEGSAKWKRSRRLADGEPERFQVLTLDGRIVGAVHVADQKLRVGRAAIRKADVGHVSIRPELQGRGYGTEMMTRLVAWLRQAGYDVARLGGRVSFYRRFGWVPFPRRFVEFALARLDEAAFAAMTAASGDGRVRPFDPARDATARDTLRQEFHAARTGAYNPGPGDAPRSVQLVWEQGGRVRGYLAASLTGVDHTPFEAPMQIGEVVCDGAHPEAVAELVKAALREARAVGVDRVSARLPFDQRVLDALREADVGFSLHELEGRPGSNMLQIIDIESLFRRLRRELEARLAASASAAWEGAIAIDADGRRVRLALERGDVAVAQAATPSFELRLGQAALMRLVLGLNSIDEVARDQMAALQPAERSLLRDLFPIQPTASGPWG